MDCTRHAKDGHARIKGKSKREREREREREQTNPPRRRFARMPSPPIACPPPWTRFAFVLPPQRLGTRRDRRPCRRGPSPPSVAAPLPCTDSFRLAGARMISVSRGISVGARRACIASPPDQLTVSLAVPGIPLALGDEALPIAVQIAHECSEAPRRALAGIVLVRYSGVRRRARPSREKERGYQKPESERTRAHATQITHTKAPPLLQELLPQGLGL